MKLLIDQGNSYLKWAERSTGEWRTGRLATPNGSQLASELNRAMDLSSTPVTVWISSVADSSVTEALCNWVRQRWSLEPLLLSASAQACGVKNSYQEPGTLGSDRWAALIGVRHRYHYPACIIDCGTAVTVDLLDDQAVFRGGVIFPGLGLARDSLSLATAKLRSTPVTEVNCASSSTSAAIASGTLLGIVGAIEYFVDCQRQLLNSELAVYVTGGDARTIAARLKIPCTVIDDLVLQGLEVVAEEKA